MKKFSISAILLMIFLVSISNQAFAQKTDYEKYGRIAIAIVAADYPSDEIREYQYMGRANINADTVADTFRFEVEEKGKKFPVTINVVHGLKNDKLLNITVQTAKP